MPQKLPTIDDIDQVVDAWFAECIQQPPIAYSVESYNQAHAAQAELKRRLCVLITGEEPLLLEPEMQADQAEPQPLSDPEPAATETRA